MMEPGEQEQEDGDRGPFPNYKGWANQQEIHRSQRAYKRTQSRMRVAHNSIQRRIAGPSTDRATHECYRCGELGHYRQECKTEVRACHACGEYGHLRRSCPYKMRCYHCDQWGHTHEQCGYRGPGEAGWEEITEEEVRTICLLGEAQGETEQIVNREEFEEEQITHYGIYAQENGTAYEDDPLGEGEAMLNPHEAILKVVKKAREEFEEKIDQGVQEVLQKWQSSNGGHITMEEVETGSVETGSNLEIEVRVSQEDTTILTMEGEPPAILTVHNAE